MNIQLISKVTLTSLILLVSLIQSLTFAETKSEALMQFLVGSYDVIGRKPDSSELYSGKVKISLGDGNLKIERNIEGKNIICLGKIENLKDDEITVLRTHIKDGKMAYEATYQIDSDFNNYGRLTGFVYSKQGNTEKPGLEALFNRVSYE